MAETEPPEKTGKLGEKKCLSDSGEGVMVMGRRGDPSRRGTLGKRQWHGKIR